MKLAAKDLIRKIGNYAVQLNVQDWRVFQQGADLLQEQAIRLEKLEREHKLMRDCLCAIVYVDGVSTHPAWLDQEIKAMLDETRPPRRAAPSLETVQ